VEFEGRRIDHRDPTDIVRLGVVQVMEGRKVLQHLSTEQNLLVGASPHANGRTKADLERVYAYFPRLHHLRHRTAGYLSGGEQQMLVMGRALMARPKLMLLDEPSLGLAPLVVKEIFEILGKLNEEEKLTILLVEQNARLALAHAHYGYVLENGRIVLEGRGEELRNNEDIKEFYLGLSLLGGRRSYREVKHYKRRKRWLG
jgi:branched-chain amino acid transport system ATP-binding protein